jgi:hypothetical protein
MMEYEMHTKLCIQKQAVVGGRILVNILLRNMTACRAQQQTKTKTNNYIIMGILSYNKRNIMFIIHENKLNE